MPRHKYSNNNPKRNEQKEEGSIYGLRYKQKINSNQRPTSDCVLLKQRLKYIKYQNTMEIDDINPDLLYYLQCTTWALNRMSPIYDLDYREVTLKKYAARIKKSIAKNIKDVEINSSINTKIVKLNTITLEENNEDFITLQIEVTQKQGVNKEAIKYKGVILIWRRHNKTDDQNFPLLFCNGTISIKRIVHYTLQEIFNIVIRPIEILGDEIFWLCTLAGFSSRLKDKHIKLHYVLPGTKHYVCIQLLIQLAHNLWKSVNEDSDEITLAEVLRFKQVLQDELCETFHIKTDKLYLEKLILPVITLHAEGKIKFHEADVIIRIVHFLQDMADILSPLNNAEP